MGSSFNPQILVDKLAKLNSSQASIETLSHWCIFHMNKAKHVVETWDRQFHCAPREQRLAYLYLANDILQNSRRKGAEFVGEFWRVLPDALRDVLRNGDELGRNAALRLINIWEERKVFGSRGQILKEELLGRRPENGSRNGKHMPVKLKQPIGNTVDKIISGYEVLYGGQTDEDVILSKCSGAVSYIEKVEKEVGDDLNSGHSHGAEVVKEVQGQHAVLRDCIEQLRAVEMSRIDLVACLREALHEQETKLEQIRNQLQVAQSQSDRADNLCRELLNHDNSQLATEQNSKEVHTSMAPQSFSYGDREQSAPVMYTQQASFPEKSSQAGADPRKSAAAAVAAKLTASTSSVQMLSYVLSSLASEGIIVNPPEKESPSSDYPPEKRPKLENQEQPYIPPQNPHQPAISEDQPYIPPQNPQQPALSFTETMHQNIATTAQEAPPLPSSPSPPPLPPQLPVPPYQVPQFLQPLQPPGPINSIPFSYSMSAQPQVSIPGYTPAAAPVTSPSPFTPATENSYQSFQGSEGFYTPTSSTPMAPITRQ